MKKEIFSKRSYIHAPAETVFEWHTRPGALERLTPPWNPIQVVKKKGGIEKGATAAVKMRIGPIPFTWVAEHTDYEKNRFFRDRQVRGPLAHWVHTHLFEPDGPNACVMEDHVEYALRAHPFGHFLAGSKVRKDLEKMFQYRHTTIARDIAAHLPETGRPPRNILVSGASGIVGSSLVPFLTTGGHRVIRLVRKTPAPGTDEVFWNPISGQLDPKDLEGTDTVIHLAGENIGQGRWTPEKKKRIIESRTRGTELVARKIAELDSPPEVMICASAIGYYGNRDTCTLTENDSPGDDFISDVCEQWETAAMPAVRKGIRVVFMRIGIALTPAGGALERLLLPFQMGLGGKIGTGEQFMSWIGMDDVIGAIHHAIVNEHLEGPVNVVAPHPVSNLEFTKTLGKVLSRPTSLSVPSLAIRMAFGEMGREIPLSSTRVKPKKLLETGYRFHDPNLEDALSHLLGKDIG